MEINIKEFALNLSTKKRRRGSPSSTIDDGRERLSKKIMLNSTLTPHKLEHSNISLFGSRNVGSTSPSSRRISNIQPVAVEFGEAETKHR